MQDGCRIFGSGKYGKMAKKYQHHKLPSCLGYPKHEGKDEENLTHFFRHYLSELSFYRILHERGLLERMEHDFVLAADEFHHKTKFANEMWQTDFTYFKVKDWGWYYLSTVIDDYSRYIIHWELCSSMTSEDVSRTIDKSIEKAGVALQNPPCLLSDNGPCYIASSLKQYLCKELLLSGKLPNGTIKLPEAL